MRTPSPHLNLPRTLRRELVCIETATPPRLAVQSVELPRPGNGEVLVRVQATSVNPIDVKRAAGYGRRLLGLKGAASVPLVLGNDVAGIVESTGAGATRFAQGQSVFGLLGTGRGGGAHASHVVVPQDFLLPAPDDADLTALAVLPYSFTTMWLALRSTGITAGNARGARVLINGANGGLGRLALQLLHPRGSEITAICGKGQVQVALDLGAQVAVEHRPGCIESLPSDFRRGAELRPLGRRCVAGVAPRSAGLGPRHHGASFACQLRPVGVAGRCAGQPPRPEPDSQGCRFACAECPLCLDHLQARP